MKEKAGLAARIEMIRELLAVEGSLSTHEIKVYFASMGVDGRLVEQTLHHAYKNRVTHRRKLKSACGYEYRLASKYPRWGTRYEAEPKTRKQSVVSTCKRKSQVYQLDQLLKAARGGHAPAN
ncbi:hypothetical protein [Pantoea sp. ACRSB]|uniref:hypothetical protein n=1 Tax=Pantoea sp. ACRSB TaxID=2918207 RepID=UPI002892DCA1|nr:hypothetical protein [Pantoea sp. ACRSB]MCG7388774.1 hypothetical protein [Pantoea sp. ACRSB]